LRGAFDLDDDAKSAGRRPLKSVARPLMLAYRKDHAFRNYRIAACVIQNTSPELSAVSSQGGDLEAFATLQILANARRAHQAVRMALSLISSIWVK
jgi:hypothetical protein